MKHYLGGELMSSQAQGSPVNIALWLSSTSLLKV